MKAFVFALMALCLQFQSVCAQVTGRIEYSTRGDYEDQFISALGNRGLLIYSMAKDSENGKRYFKTEYYSTEMKFLFADSMLVDKGMYIYDAIYENGVNYCILRERDGSFSVLAFDLKTRKTKVTDSEYTRKGSMRDLIITNGMMVFSSTQKKMERIGIIDLKTGSSKFADIHFNGVRDRKIFLMENTIIDGIIYALVKVEEEIYLVCLDMQGNQLGETNLTKDIPERLITISVSKAGDKYFATGTYSRSKKDGAQGIYFTQLADWQFKNIKFYNFLDLKNFTDYMSDRRKARVERKKERAEKAGKEYSLKYLMASHHIMTDGTDYFYLGEAYFPTYTTTRMGNIVTTTFNGYAYTHAVLAKFNEQGNLLWDNCFKMEPDRLPMYVKRFISGTMMGKDVKLIFTDGKWLVSKLFKNSDGTILQDRKTERLETADADETVKKVSSSNSLHWYDDNFIVYGTQVVKNKETGERRKVFSITKYTIK